MEQLQYYVYIGIIGIILTFLGYIITRVSLKDINCKRFDDIKISGGVSNIISDVSLEVDLKKSDGTTFQYNYRLKDYFIKTAYNACCSGKIKNDYVDLCALENVKKYGVRALDFQLFSLNGNPIVASSTMNHNLYKESYNHLHLSDVMHKTNSLFIEEPVNEYPLFLFFRIHYGDKEKSNESYITAFYDKVYKQIYDHFPSSSGFSFNSEMEFEGMKYDEVDNVMRLETISNMTLQNIKKRIFIFVSLNDVNYDPFNKSKLSTITDNVVVSESSGVGMKYYKLNELQHEMTSSIVDENKRYLSICYPMNDVYSLNKNAAIPMAKGIQFVAMNYQNDDPNLKKYNNYFKTNSNKNAPVTLKPNNLISIGSYGAQYGF